MKPKFPTIILYLVIFFNLFLMTGIFKPKHQQKVSSSMNEQSQMTINVQNQHRYHTDQHGKFIVHSSLVIGNRIHFKTTNPTTKLKVVKNGTDYQANIRVPKQQATKVTIYSSGKELTNSKPVTITVKNNQKLKLFS